MLWSILCRLGALFLFKEKSAFRISETVNLGRFEMGGMKILCLISTKIPIEPGVRNFLNLG